MAKTGRFFDSLESAFGKGSVTDGYRDQATQDGLRARGVTRTVVSSHTARDGYDLAPWVGKSADEVAAKAAAHGITLGHLIYETGKGPNQGTGPHWHGEVMNGQAGPTTPRGTPMNGSTPGQGVANPQAFLQDLQSTLAPETAASGNVSVNAPTIQGGDGKMASLYDTLDQAANAASDKVDMLGAATQAAHAVQTQSLANEVADTRAISNEIVQGTEDLKNATMPVFAARQQVANQLDKLNTMNPIVRGFKGIFDLNYDQGHLESQLHHFDETLKARQDDFNYINNLHSVALQEIDRRYKLDNAMPGLLVDQAKEDSGIAGMHLQAMAGMVQNFRDHVAGEAQMINAKAMANNDLLGRLDEPTITKLMTQAQKNHGNVDFNGGNFSYSQLHQEVQKRQQVDLNTQMTGMAIANGRMDLAEKTANNLIDSMSEDQVKAAIAAGGKWNGIQLPMPRLNATLQSHLAAGDAIAQDVATHLPAASILKFAADTVTQNAAIYGRASSLFGDQDNAAAQPILQQQRELTHQLITAQKSGAAGPILEGLQARIAANSKALNDHVDSVILRSVGGDKQAGQYVKSFIQGTPMDAGTATQAMTYFALRGGLQGVANVLSPEAKQIFQLAQKSVLTHQGQLDSNGKVISQDRLKQIVTQEVGSSAQYILGQARFDRAYGSLPQIAKSAGNPLGNIAPQQWTQLTTAAQGAAAKVMADKISTTPDNVLKMVQTHKPIDDKPESAALFQNFTKNYEIYNAAEIDNTIHGIDELPHVQPGTPNSTILHQFLLSSEMAQMANQYTSSLGAHSMGDYLVNPMGEGVLPATIQQHGQKIAQRQAIVQADNNAAARRAATMWGNSPVARVQTIVASVPGVDKEGATALTPFIQQVLSRPDAQPNTGEINAAQYGSVNPNAIRQNQMVISALQSTKFQDPRLEMFRKKVVAGWPVAHDQANGFVDTLLHFVGVR